MMTATIHDNGPDNGSTGLPPVRGRLDRDAPLTKLTWFRTGGPAELLFQPADEADLIGFLRQLDPAIPVMVIGVGSNLLVRDGGIDGVVIRLGKPFARIEVDGGVVRAGAGAMDVTVAAAAQQAGLTGMEFLRGVPGTIGGALRMNAGAYGTEMADILISARAVDRAGRVHPIDRADMGYSYRRSTVPADWIFLSADLQGQPDDREAIAGRMMAISAARENAQPLRTRTGGSTFKNPDPGLSDGRSAWQLIEEAGCRGLARGDAVVSDKHCNFLINRGGATAADIEALGEDVRRRVKAATGVALDWEIRRVGKHRADPVGTTEVTGTDGGAA